MSLIEAFIASWIEYYWFWQIQTCQWNSNDATDIRIKSLWAFTGVKTDIYINNISIMTWSKAYLESKSTNLSRDYHKLYCLSLKQAIISYFNRFCLPCMHVTFDWLWTREAVSISVHFWCMCVDRSRDVTSVRRQQVLTHSLVYTSVASVRDLSRNLGIFQVFPGFRDFLWFSRDFLRTLKSY